MESRPCTVRLRQSVRARDGWGAHVRAATGNSSYIFPGLGLGVLAVRARRITDPMFLTAARELARQVSAEDLAQGSLYPPLSAIREVSAHIAVAEEAFTQRHAGIERPHDLLAHVRSCMYDPSYPDDA